ncbi:diguanylate cyclase (GGDEF) domain-containing protein [Burkholderia sp. Ch1-1]|uniref:Diguanylate cyclase (GGDEF) domain-containing protein n=1 Tax=Paraburkholderia dioscoreae TaxID=2604047 RepID=A0A5Q4ZM65_9BURK|nr:MULTISPECIES: EAL domain-containing protein [Paraburkholderia]EIF34062.1 diguanylate cyclase (GGDEF) domain-containing protein [Burkholderia sp. Ch1-1]MDR8396084.1 EAL domain-containing protein [Paraburkholderia sp. USG1]VVD32976.1 Diguanylate cyclase (GGDEF) domain-containing protein [Paraburkholderia dioscoreae]
MKKLLEDKPWAVVQAIQSIIAAPASAELRRSQYKAFSRQVPLLYVLLVVNTAAVVFTHFRVAPRWLAVYLPLALCVACAARVVLWLRARKTELPDDVIAHRLRTTLRLTAGFGAAFTVWGLLLFPYGDAYAQCHVAFYMSITVIGCIFCLMHMRAAALLMTCIVVAPFAVFFLMSQHAVLIAISINMVLVSAVMIVILLIYYRDFADLVESQRKLLIKQAETERLSVENLRLANLDGLTGLPNRRRFFSDLDKLLTAGGATGQGIAVGVVDLDGFKPINDLYGHHFGDRLLEEVGRRLTSLSSPSLIAARVGGDEFGLLFSGDVSQARLCDLGAAICATLQRPYELTDVTARLTASLGVAVFPEAGTTAIELSERADYALSFAKNHRRGATAIFSREHETQIRRCNEIEQALKLADFEREISVFFQPIFDVSSKGIVAFEALARWTSPSLGTISPVDFLAVAEKTDMIHSMTHVLLRKALEAAAAWPPQTRIAFNLSARDVSSPEAIDGVIRTALASGVAPERINFEVTETALIKNVSSACETLGALKKLGAEVSLDDFGTGYSSLSYVHRLPIDKLKVDRSFIADIVDDPAARAVVKSIVDLSKNLGLTCVVEGVETASQVNVLLGLGCTVMQGYFFGRPVAGEDVLESFVTNGFITARSAAASTL